VRPASEAEKARLAELFTDLCRIPSPFGREQECAERVRAELRAIGVEPAEDETGNLLAHIAGREERSVLLCAHMDTVEADAPIEPVLVDDGWENANAAILGADNKAALAVMLAVARRARIEGSPVGIELLFTVSEEDSLAGAKAFDATRLRSRFGYVFDHATPIGEVITASPTAYRIDAEFHGKAAHAGIRPEDGRSAVLAAARAIAEMPLGRYTVLTLIGSALWCFPLAAVGWALGANWEEFHNAFGYVDVVVGALVAAAAVYLVVRYRRRRRARLAARPEPD
jgi:tripeptide aminopeptidase